MTRTQIQLPDPLYRDLKRIADEQDWSLAEVIRRAGELYAQRFPQKRLDASFWSLPPAMVLGESLAPLDEIRAEADVIVERTPKR